MNSEHSITGLLGEGTFFNGHLSFQGVVKIGGEFKGRVTSKGTLVVQKTASVEGDLEVAELIVFGELKNVNIVASKQVVLEPTAMVTGSVKTPVFKVQDGAVFDGYSEMLKKQ